MDRAPDGVPGPGAALAELEEVLGAPPPAGVAEADPAAVATLAAAVRSAHENQERALAEATERALSHIPKVLRRPVSRLLGGGG